MSLKTVTGQLAAAVADAGTLEVSYPSGYDAANFYGAHGHKLLMGQGLLSSPDDFSVAHSSTVMTITNKSGGTWPAATNWTLELQEPGQRGYKSGRSNGALLKNATEAKVLKIALSPNVLDADGVCESQTVTFATTPLALINGALSDGELATSVATFDTPRAIAATWTGTAVVTFTGTDAYGDELVEVSASGTSHNGTKAFKTITSVSCSANTSSFVVGTTDIFGLPVYLPSKAHVLRVLQDGEPLPAKEVLRAQIDQTRLLAGTSVYVQNSSAGIVERMTSVVTTAINTTGGSLTAEIATVAVAGLAVVIAVAAVGDVDTDQPNAAVLSGHDVTGLLAARQGLEIVGDAAFDSTGAVDVIVDLNTQGVFQAGIQTSGGSTGTTGDVRGTFRPPVAADGSKVFEIFLALPDAGYTGIAQYSV
jgi:hypothetical protein